jgi:hypothetical protein
MEQDIVIGNETSVETLVNLIKEQTKELKINKKKLEKLEEKFVKTNTDLKNVLKDKLNLENFLRTIFSKEMHENIIKTDYGLYDTSDLNKIWLINEQRTQNEYHRVLNLCRNENSELNEKIKNLNKEIDNKTSELETLKKNQMQNFEQLNFYMNNYNEVFKKVDNLENEKKYLMDLLSQKEEEIRILNSLELEMAELKAKSLLDDIIEKNDIKPAIISQTQTQEKIKISNIDLIQHLLTLVVRLQNKYILLNMFTI